MDWYRIPYAVGAVILGLVGFAFGDFALQWQAVPAQVPRGGWSHLSAALLLLAGGGVLVHRSARAAALVLGCMYAFWVFVFHGPNVMANGEHMGAWNAPAEIIPLALTGFTLYLAAAAPGPGLTTRRAVGVLFGVCAVVFGVCHLVYADFTATFVPAWLPWRLFWAYATGIGHIAAGVALISGVWTRLATLVYTGMLASFVLLVHVPRLIATPTVHAEWVMLGISLSLTGAALIAHATYKGAYQRTQPV